MGSSKHRRAHTRDSHPFVNTGGTIETGVVELTVVHLKFTLVTVVLLHTLTLVASHQVLTGGAVVARGRLTLVYL